MPTLRDIADERRDLDWKSDTYAYLADLIRRNWEAGADTMILQPVVREDLTEKFIARISQEAKEKVDRSLQNRSELLKGANVFHYATDYTRRDLEDEKKGLVDVFANERLVTLLTVAIRGGLIAVGRLDVDYFDHVREGSGRIGARPHHVGDTFDISGKILLK